MTTINVCIGSACHLKGSYNIINRFQDLIKKNNMDDEVVVKAAFCLGECTKAVSVKVDEGEVYSVNDTNVEEFFNKYVIGRV
ncbi:(2Fe-2S) ferredoxin domain-containing protein [Acidilutibacter cellobiosedens]|jgi:NADH:ubiquinone oxidoreductase subunit E|uniref:(2Fe-2S) ferredoxin domain-containing protein n=1 Tax=Acidilutibacter cellobiosedens TaxID=2507161 RepID=A0A410QEW2_9FIRM|nr:(2Fe-2S) ferredoxin domain-containing protein [Tissierellaceae bacterium]QAT62632.1 (2Fe-2S) ferredoxin domain-containing protein [Acidilutibacter cellobiosedens]